MIAKGLLGTGDLWPKQKAAVQPQSLPTAYSDHTGTCALEMWKRPRKEKALGVFQEISVLCLYTLLRHTSIRLHCMQYIAPHTLDKLPSSSEHFEPFREGSFNTPVTLLPQSLCMNSFLCMYALPSGIWMVHFLIYLSLLIAFAHLGC